MSEASSRAALLSLVVDCTMPAEMPTDTQVMAAIASAADDRWLDLFAMPLWSDPTAATDADLGVLAQRLYDLGVIVPFDWPAWYGQDHYPAGRGLETATVADAVRLLASCVRGDRFCEGALFGRVVDGSVPAAVSRLWSWYRGCVVGQGEFVDRAEYSADGVYRWFYVRRWATGGAMCWVGLNPGTGDTDAGRRPTLRRVVSWARRSGCGAVVVVNLFSFRATDPKSLLVAHVDIIGDRTDDTIQRVSSDAVVTLAAWGAHKVIRGRSRQVLELLDDPMCVGVTKNGEPRHPLYVPESTILTPYGRPG